VKYTPLLRKFVLSHSADRKYLLHLAVFASGQGSNLAAIYDSIISGKLSNVELSLVVSNNSQSGAIAFAKKNRIKCIHLSLLQFEGDQKKFEAEMLAVLSGSDIDLIVLAGYMKRLPDGVVEKYRGRILNIHPALLPDFGGAGMYGLNVHNAVIAAKKKTSGASVHFVEGEYDSGEIILQESCPVYENDTPQILAERIRNIEHIILPKAIQIVADSIKK
jgi:phosphoribosylglycinamide formyltransferase-1